ncbi:MAG TPA: nucleotidyltransferase family protein [Lacunisphaera sp.]|jgi:dTDP-glucose pyrophosphorylase/predicted transcriptional regulator
MNNVEQTNRFQELIVSPDLSIAEAVARLDKAGLGALLLCDSGGRLKGLLADGDVRRAILQKKSFDSPCETIACLHPITVKFPVLSADALRVMDRHEIDHLPVLDGDGCLHDFILRRDFGTERDQTANTQQRLESVVILPSASIAEAIVRLNKAGTGALVLCNDNRFVAGLLTDGDIRRAILKGTSMDTACSTIASTKPVVVPPSFSRDETLKLMNQHDINHVPVVDSENRLLEFLLRRDLAVNVTVELSAVIMAGGFGKRLLPLTERVPKPMLPVGDRPLLELTIQQLRRSGIRDVSLTTHYLPESIVDHFGDGQEFGVRLNYLKEDNPMGTAGGLKRMKRPANPFLVINGDILTGVPFREMLAYHRKHGAILTVGVRKYDVQVPFGVVECEDIYITRLQEKPSLGFFINAGTYLLEPSACDYIPDGRPFDMTDLIQKLLEAGRPVVSFPIMEYWLDVGRHEDYQKAQDDVLKGRI